MISSDKAMYAAVFLLLTMLFPALSFAHCDSVAGPVAKDVRTALTSGELSPVLKWIRPADETELRAAFERTLAVRKSGKDAAALADQFFLETAVRLHRASEGEPYTGLKPAPAAEEAAPALVDTALSKDSLSSVEEPVILEVRAALRARIAELEKARKDAENSPIQGRAYVRAYVELIHYIERVESGGGASSADWHAHE
jgi:hypothetical protein